MKITLYRVFLDRSQYDALLDAHPIWMAKYFPRMTNKRWTLSGVTFTASSDLHESLRQWVPKLESERREYDEKSTNQSEYSTVWSE